MKKSIPLAFLALVALWVSVLLSGCAPASTSVPPTSTPLPANTPIPPTVIPTATQTPTPAFVPGPIVTPAAPDSTLFIADAESRDLTYRFRLFDAENKELKVQAVDFSTKNWDVHLTNSGFNSAHGSQFVHYNPLTREIVFVLFTYPASELAQAAAESHGAPADPPYRFEIYKTAFDSQNEFVPLYIGAARTFSLSHTVLYPPDNALFVDAEVLGEARHPEIRKFDIGTGQFEHIVNPVTSLGGKDLRDRSDLRLSPDGQKLYQLLRYRNPSSEADPNGVFNQTLFLMTIDLDARSVDYQEITTGDNIEYGMRALSADGNRVAFFTRVPFDGDYFLWVKDLSSEQVRSIPIPGEIGNINLFMTADGKKILVGRRDGPSAAVRTSWEIYDLNTEQYQATPLDHPQAWDSSGRYLVGEKDNTYVIYDLETLSVLDIGLPFPAGLELLSVQWR